MRKLLVALLSATVLFSACSVNNVDVDDSLGRFFDSAGVKGCFALFDNGQGRFTIYNLPRYRDSGYAPGQTFDIVELLVGLQTGQLKNEKQILVTDGLANDTANAMSRPANRPITLTQAFQSDSLDNSLVFARLEQNIGYDTLKKWVDSLRYGNQQIGKDSMTMSMRVPADQQLGLIKKLYFNQLPFFKRPQEIVQGMLTKEENTNYKLVYKTALIHSGDHMLGWALGWVEENKHPYFFAVNFDAPATRTDADKIGIQLVKHILPSMGFFEGKK